MGAAAFETPIGLCGIAWGPDGLTRTALPAEEPARMEAWLRRGGEESADPPPVVRAAIAQIRALLEGAAPSLQDIALDLTGLDELDRRIYALARAILPGATRSYGEIAADLGDPMLARAVGQAMAKNRFPIIVPCHRVLAAGGRSGGFSAPGGIATKRRMLAIESVHARREGDLFA
ncbi:MAG: methylated-DNA--[protein]-cysteine S-methyltransferase [Alphaproteobacteria bacterium]|nr:methylated-DNA--[protein]-cysteine S-methyltransferase [Alphaproteobacteria bacterium]